MHVLHLDAGHELRGGQLQILTLIRALVEAGYRNTLLTDPRGPLREAAQNLPVPVVAPTIGSLRKLKNKADILHAHDARAHTLAALAGWHPSVISRRVAFPIGRGIFSQWKYRRGDRYLAVSECVAGELRSGGVPAERIEVVYDGVELPPPEWHAPDPQRFRAVTPASDDPQKGRDLIEQASTLVGIPVEFADMLVESLRRASVFLHITRSEGLGSAALMAMAMGVPVIASRVGGLPEAVRDGREGLLVANDPGQIGRALQRLRDDPALAGRLGREGRRRVEELFTARHMAERTAAAYRRALDARCL